jgi:hypothetical protein
MTKILSYITVFSLHWLYSQFAISSLDIMAVVHFEVYAERRGTADLRSIKPAFYREVTVVYNVN